MKTIIEEKPVSFKTLEQKIFTYVCELAQETARLLLESRDRSHCWDKGLRTTIIKTGFGEVAYRRRVWYTRPFLQMEGEDMYTCWTRPCTWIRSA